MPCHAIGSYSQAKHTLLQSAKDPADTPHRPSISTHTLGSARPPPPAPRGSGPALPWERPCRGYIPARPCPGPLARVVGRGCGGKWARENPPPAGAGGGFSWAVGQAAALALGALGALAGTGTTAVAVSSSVMIRWNATVRVRLLATTAATSLRIRVLVVLDK